MKKENVKWDRMQKDFNTACDGSRGQRAADNVLIAWPIIMQMMSDYHSGTAKVLDYGCGSGAFCRHLRNEGFSVEGMDYSDVMIRTALKHSSAKIRYHVGGKETLKKMPKDFNVITSMMVFQFIEDLESYIPLFHDLLTYRGLLVFAVHNPDFVKDCYRDKVMFRSLRPKGKTTVASMEMKKGVTIDTYVRSRDKYRTLFEKHGFEYLSSQYPPFTQEFVDMQKWKLPSESSEFLIMALRKKQLEE